jgi:DNA polymerase-1
VENPDLGGRTVWAIDTLSRVYQLFHALPEMSAPDGTPVSAVFGLTRDLLDITERRRPDYLFCAMDAPGPTFRHERFAAYKANRAEMPADLVPQIPLVRRLLATCGVPCLERPGFEADDLLATLAVRTTAAGGACVIATSDKDARQLICDRVQLLNLRTNATFGAPELLAEWGIRPDQVVDFLALVGDAVDNVPGVPGIGPKIAAELLAAHDTLDGVLAHIDDVSGVKRRDNLRAHSDTARAGRELIRLATAVPLDIPWKEGRCHPPDPAALADFLREMGFKSLLAKVVQDVPRDGGRAAATRATNRTAAPTLFALDDDGGADDRGTDDRGADARGHGDRDAAASPAAATPATPLVTPADEEQLAALVTRLRAAAPVAISCARPPAVGADGRSMTPPTGLVAAAGDTAVWVGADRLAAGPAHSPSLCGLLADAAVPKTGHDLKRQTVALAARGVELAGCWFDTMLAAYLLEAGERNLGLAEVATRHGIEPSWPPATTTDAAAASLADIVDDPADEAAAAAACGLVRALAERLPPLLEAAGLARLFHEVEMPLASVLARMEQRGVRIDRGVLEALSVDYAARLAALEAEIHALAGHPFAIASPLQVRTVLFDELGLPVVKRTKTGASTDAEVLEQLAPQHPLPARLLEHRRYAKLKSTYVDALPALVHPATGRIHTSFNQTATATGRLSSSDPNLQNIPVRSVAGQQIRAAFLPREQGWRFIAADYSQIELRILAHLSGDEAMRQAFAAGEDIHTSTAAAVFGIVPAAVTPALRRTAKAVNFGILYGQSGFGLAKALGIPLAEASAFIAAYFRSFAGAAAFIDDVLDACRRDGRVTTMLGRRRAIAGVRDRDGRRSSAGGFALSLPERTAINTVVQGSAADLIKLAMLGVSRRLAEAGSVGAIVLQIHDELLLEAPAAEAGAVARIVVDEMLHAMTLDVPLEVSVHEGSTWAACEK